MQRAVDAARFVDARMILRTHVVVSRFQLLHGNFVRRVAIDLGATEEDKYRLRTMLARGFQKIYRAQRVDLKIDQRNFPRLVVRRLRCAVHDQVKPPAAKQRLERRAAANIQGGVLESLGAGFQPLQVPQRVPGRSKKNAPHIVVDAENFMTFRVEMRDRLGANQPAAAGNQNFHDSESLSKVGDSAAMDSYAYSVGPFSFSPS